MWTLYGTRGSGSAAVEAALVLLGEPLTKVDAASWQPGQGQDALLRLNPMGQIPTLVDAQGQVLTESAAILIELGLRSDPGRLLPSDETGRARAIQGLVYIAVNCYAAISVIDYPERWSDPCDELAKAHIRAGTRARLHHHWRLFADQFGAGFDAASPGALELLATVVSRWSGSRQMLQSERPAFWHKLVGVERHPAVAPVFQAHWPP